MWNFRLNWLIFLEAMKKIKRLLFPFTVYGCRISIKCRLFFHIFCLLLSKQSCVSDHVPASSTSLNVASSYRTDGHVSRIRVNDARSQMQTRRNVAKMLIAVVVMFGVCFLPVHLLNILRSSSFSTGAFQASTIIMLQQLPARPSDR